MIIYTGNAAFEDVYTPAKSKNEWGVDTLVREMQGAAPLLDEFIESLAQGDEFEGYFLQTWEPDKDPIFPTVTLFYKGLLDGAIPAERITRNVVSALGQTSRDFSEENDGLGRLYRKDLLWQIGDTVPGPGSFGTTVAYTRDRYTTGVKMQFTYKAMQTTYRYITDDEPVAPAHSTVGVDYTQDPQNHTIVTADGSIYGRQGWEQFFGLEPVQFPKVISFEAENVIGTPYWECTDVIRLELGDEED